MQRRDLPPSSRGRPSLHNLTLACRCSAASPCFQILNKIDTLVTEEWEPLQRWFEDNCRAERIIPASALKGKNVDAIVEWVVSKLPESPSLYPKVATAVLCGGKRHDARTGQPITPAAGGQGPLLLSQIAGLMT